MFTLTQPAELNVAGKGASPGPASPSAPPECELTVVMPCLNEADTIEVCVSKALRAIELAGLDAEVVVADNGSTDGSQALAEKLGGNSVALYNLVIIAVAALSFSAGCSGAIDDVGRSIRRAAAALALC